MKPSALKRFTAGFDPVSWLAAADQLDEAGLPPEPWRMRGLVGVAIDGWLKEYAKSMTVEAMMAGYKPLVNHLRLPDGLGR